MLGRSIFVIMFFITSLFGMENPKESLEFSIMTYNVCNFYGMAESLDASHITWEKRKERIFTLILDEKPDLIGFQELRDDNGKSTIKDLWNGLGDDGYEIIHYRYDSSPSSYMNAIAYNSKKFMLRDAHNWWLSSSPYVCSRITEKERPRRALMLSLYPIKNESEIDYSCPIYIANVHNSINHEIKMETNRILVEQIDFHISSLKTGIVIVTGDFNTLINDSQKTINELAVLHRAGYKELLKTLVTKNGIPVSGTFNGYSCDRYKIKEDTLGGQLDHIFLKVISPDISYESKSHVNVKRYNGNDNENARTEVELLAGIDGKKNRDEFPSDHIPGIAVLKVFFNNK